LRSSAPFCCSPCHPWRLGIPSENHLKRARNTQEQAEQAAREQREANERAAKSVEEKKAAEERQQREATEHQHQEAERTEAERIKGASEQKSDEAAPSPSSGVIVCIVPALSDVSLTRAKILLHKAHCKLGSVTGDHRDNRALVVVTQKRKAGTRLAADAAVGVTLGLPKHKRH
jgi:hypothetical protein